MSKKKDHESQTKRPNPFVGILQAGGQIAGLAGVPFVSQLSSLADFPKLLSSLNPIGLGRETMEVLDKFAKTVGELDEKYFAKKQVDDFNLSEFMQHSEPMTDEESSQKFPETDEKIDEEINEKCFSGIGIDFGLGKVDPVFRLAAYTHTLVKMFCQECNSKTHDPANKTYDALVDKYRMQVCESGVSVLGILKAASNYFKELSNNLPDNIAFKSLKSFSGAISKPLEVVHGDLDKVLTNKVRVFDNSSVENLAKRMKNL